MKNNTATFCQGEDECSLIAQALMHESKTVEVGPGATIAMANRCKQIGSSHILLGKAL